MSTGPYRNCLNEAGTKIGPDTYFVPVQKKGWKIDPHVSNLRSREFSFQGVQVEPIDLFIAKISGEKHPKKLKILKIGQLLCPISDFGSRRRLISKKRKKHKKTFYRRKTKWKTQRQIVGALVRLLWRAAAAGRKPLRLLSALKEAAFSCPGIFSKRAWTESQKEREKSLLQDSFQ